MFGKIRTDDNGRADLKIGGLMPIFTAARVLAIRHDVRARSTPERFRGVAAAGVGAPSDIEAIIAAHRLLLGTMLEQQLADTQAGVPLSPRVEIGRLSKAAAGRAAGRARQYQCRDRSRRRGPLLISRGQST